MTVLFYVWLLLAVFSILGLIEAIARLGGDDE